MPIQPVPLQLPPGVFSVPTKASKSANWAETNLVRWVQGRMQPIGGWSKLNLSPFASPLMKVHRWNTNTGIMMTAYLCAAHVYVDSGAGLVNVSPVPALAPPSGSYVQGGYGDNVYNLGLYGTPRPDRDATFSLPAVYSMDNWGEDLLVMTSTDGRLLRWDATNPNAAVTVVPNAPTGNRMFLVTPSRQVMIFHPGGVLNKFEWCDEEDIEDWTPGVASKAGDLNFQPASPVVTAEFSGNDILFFAADNNAYLVRYIGLPYIFGVEKFNSDASPMSPAAIIDTPNGCVWASHNGFWVYSSGSAVPIPCTAWDWAEANMDKTAARNMAVLITIPQFSELYLFFPSNGSMKNDRYLAFNYREGWWATGRLSRSCGTKSSYNGYPLLSDGTSVFQHESGSVYTLLPGEEPPWARLHSISIQDGAVLHSWGIMTPDVGGDTGAVVFQLDYNIERTGDVNILSDEYPIVEGMVGWRETARDARMTIKQVDANVRNWTFGNTLVEITPRGRA